jgi:hypothetical protein
MGHVRNYTIGDALTLHSGKHGSVERIPLGRIAPLRPAVVLAVVYRNGFHFTRRRLHSHGVNAPVAKRGGRLVSESLFHEEKLQ